MPRLSELLPKALPEVVSRIVAAGAEVVAQNNASAAKYAIRKRMKTSDSATKRNLNRALSSINQ